MWKVVYKKKHYNSYTDALQTYLRSKNIVVTEPFDALTYITDNNLKDLFVMTDIKRKKKADKKNIVFGAKSKRIRYFILDTGLPFKTKGNSEPPVSYKEEITKFKFYRLIKERKEGVVFDKNLDRVEYKGVEYNGWKRAYEAWYKDFHKTVDVTMDKRFNAKKEIQDLKIEHLFTVKIKANDVSGKTITEA
jgi:hypothetical protein